MRPCQKYSRICGGHQTQSEGYSSSSKNMVLLKEDIEQTLKSEQLDPGELQAVKVRHPS